jgi:hypothetical protein
MVMLSNFPDNSQPEPDVPSYIRTLTKHAGEIRGALAGE